METTVGKVWFELGLEHHGWARARFEVGSAAADLTASCLEDAPADLLEGLLRLRALPGTVRVTWVEEPGEFRWVFHRADEEVTVRILWFDGWPNALPDESGTEVLSAACELKALIRAVTAGLSRLLHGLGEDSYEKRWRHPIPRKALASLRTPAH